jgi:hypothetical protein
VGLELTLLPRPAANGDNHHRRERHLAERNALPRRKKTMSDQASYIPVLLILIVMAVGSIAAFFIMPPLLDKLDRVGKIGFFGF